MWSDKKWRIGPDFKKGPIGPEKGPIGPEKGSIGPDFKNLKRDRLVPILKRDQFILKRARLVPVTLEIGFQ